MTKRVTLIGLALTILVAALAAIPALAAENSVGGPKIDWKDRPARELIVALAYPNVTLSPEDKIRVDLLVRNFGRTNETVLLEVTDKPKGWVVDLKGFGKSVGGVFLAGGEEKTLTLSADPEGKADKLTPGSYHFAVKAKSADGAIVKDTAVAVKVVEKDKSSEAIKLTTSYPVLRGPSDARFEFSVDVHNDSDEDAIFNLGGQAPEGWEMGFKPAYEQKQISSLRIKAGQSQAVGVEVTPARRAEAGEYPVKVRVQSQRAKAEVDLTVALTGTYKIKAATPSGLLSTTTQVGQSTNLSIYVRNEGSALQKEISFVSFKPENWKVEFKPEKIENLKAGEVKQVEVSIIPAEQALVGDYSVGLNAQGEKATSDMELRVTVKASSAWGWIGIAVIVLVIAGLAWTFRRLGRR